MIIVRRAARKPVMQEVWLACRGRAILQKLLAKGQLQAIDLVSEKAIETV
jgi:hypothetical protein